MQSNAERIVPFSSYRSVRSHGDNDVSPVEDWQYGPATAGQPDPLTQVVTQIRDEIRSNLPQSVAGRASLCSEASTEPNHLILDGFEYLTAKWRSETAFSPTLLDIATNQSYQRIIGMGAMAIPLILRELARKPDHWFWALKAITGEDPVPEQDRGDLQRMTQAWLLWGARNGYDITHPA